VKGAEVELAGDRIRNGQLLKSRKSRCRGTKKERGKRSADVHPSEKSAGKRGQSGIQRCSKASSRREFVNGESPGTGNRYEGERERLPQTGKRVFAQKGGGALRPGGFNILLNRRLIRQERWSGEKRNCAQQRSYWTMSRKRLSLQEGV